MPIYEFKPTDLSQPDWQGVVHTDQCRVHATDEGRARTYIVEVFPTLPGPDGSVQLSPWLRPDRTECQTAQGDPAPDYREGLILVRRRRRWVAINEKELGERDRTTSGGGYARQTLPSFQQSGGNLSGTISASFGVHAALTNATTATVRHVVHNRAVVQYQASVLSNTLSDLLSWEGKPKDRRNVLPLAEALGLSDGLSDDELVALLRSLVDALNRLSEALENQTLDGTCQR